MHESSWKFLEGITTLKVLQSIPANLYLLSKRMKQFLATSVNLYEDNVLHAKYFVGKYKVHMRAPIYRTFW